jgi:hypothetical protein
MALSRMGYTAKRPMPATPRATTSMVRTALPFRRLRSPQDFLVKADTMGITYEAMTLPSRMVILRPALAASSLLWVT